MTTKKVMKSRMPTSAELARALAGEHWLSIGGQELWDTVIELAAEYLREQCGSIPFYANRAAEFKARTGDEMDYWRNLAQSGPNLF